MHKIAATPGGWNPQAEGVIFIQQTPAPIVFISAADTDIQTLAAASSKLPAEFPKLRAVNLLQLQQQLTIDTYAEEILEHAEVIIIRLLGGRSYWSYGLEILRETVEKTQAKLIIMPGEDSPDPDLISHSNVSLSAVNQLWRYFTEGGVQNFVNALKFAADTCLKTAYHPPLPQTVSRVGIYDWGGNARAGFETFQPDSDPPKSPLTRGTLIPDSDPPKSPLTRGTLIPDSDPPKSPLTRGTLIPDSDPPKSTLTRGTLIPDSDPPKSPLTRGTLIPDSDPPKSTLTRGTLIPDSDPPKSPLTRGTLIPDSDPPKSPLTRGTLIPDSDPPKSPLTRGTLIPDSDPPKSPLTRGTLIPDSDPPKSPLTRGTLIPDSDPPKSPLTRGTLIPDSDPPKSPLTRGTLIPDSDPPKSTLTRGTLIPDSDPPKSTLTRGTLIPDSDPPKSTLTRGTLIPDSDPPKSTLTRGTLIPDSDPPKSPLTRGTLIPDSDPPKSTLTRGTLTTSCSPLIKGGWGGSPGLETDAKGQEEGGHGGTAPTVGILFYRAHYLSGNLAPIDALCQALSERNLVPVPVFVSSLREPDLQVELREYFQPKDAEPIQLLLNTTSFAISGFNSPDSEQNTLKLLDVPVLQAIFSGGGLQQWESDLQGLSPRDVAMNVALPEVDGKIITRAVSFKAVQTWNSELETDVVGYVAAADRISFVADLTTNWVNLKQTPPANRRIAIILANYPTRNARLANGVGLDTPASCVEILKALQQAGYQVDNIPHSGNELIEMLTSGVTNDPEGRELRPINQYLDLAEYQDYFATLPQQVQDGICNRWGLATGEKTELLTANLFPIPGIQFGNVFVGIQPSRGYEIDPSLNYHAPDLEPTHNYLAYYYWLREYFGSQAIIHAGKHGNLEWLPGKSVALSSNCYPEVALGAMPNFYPFIVNDPGEGSQAKRRSQAVIIDHLTPPMTRAELYGPLQQLEALIDEYCEAQSLDPSRLPMIRDRIVALTNKENLDKDLGIQLNKSEFTEFITRTDGYLCELKESQIRDGLHIFGQCPQGRQLRDLIIAIARHPTNGRSGLTRALAEDSGYDFDPLTSDPTSLIQQRTAGDLTAEIETQAIQLVDKLIENLQVESRESAIKNLPLGKATKPEIDWIANYLLPSLLQTNQEITNLLHGLDGRHIPSGASGAPTRGRPDVLPTGRNFYSVDIRAIPTETAWRVGKVAAETLIERYTQENGEYPKTLGLSVWGTSTMRTGGDDIAEALALIGVQPVWDGPSRRVVDFEVLPISVLGRPRVDVTLRISGFFRDAFFNLIDLFDSAVKAVADLDEPAESNPLAAQVKQEIQDWESTGLSREEAKLRSQFRVFGSKPGAYGAGLQGIIEAQNWTDDGDLAKAYINWSSYAYTSTPPYQGGANSMNTPPTPPYQGGANSNSCPPPYQGGANSMNTPPTPPYQGGANSNSCPPPYQGGANSNSCPPPYQGGANSNSCPPPYQGGANSNSCPPPYQGGANSNSCPPPYQGGANSNSCPPPYQGGARGGEFTGSEWGCSAPEAFEKRLAQMQIVLQNQDNREHDILDSDDYYQFQGGMTAAIRNLQGKNPETYFGDNSIPENPKVRQLREEIARVYRSRAVNPKWIEGAMRHGYKGAFEIAATVDFLFAYDATANCVEDFMYEGIAEAYIFDEKVQGFIQENNPWALRDMAERLLEARQRGLWESASQDILDKLRSIALEAEAVIESHTEIR